MNLQTGHTTSKHGLGTSTRYDFPKATEQRVKLFQLLSLAGNISFPCISWPAMGYSAFYRLFPSISCSCDALCPIRCPIYYNFLVLNCLTISLPVPILLNTASLVIFSVHEIVKTLRYIATSQRHRVWTTQNPHPRVYK